MPTFRALFSLLSVASVAACTGAESPAPESPETLSVDTGVNVYGPRFSTGADKQLVLSWMERGESSAVLRYATLDAGRFTAPTDVTTESRMFVNWADVPAVTPLGEEHWVAHWLRYSADKTYSYDVVVSQSFDGGETWNEAIEAHTDGTPTEHGFVSTLPDAEGALLLWLDGRNTPDASMTLRSAVITPDGNRLDEQELDNSVCDCCQTDMALTTSGPVAVYRDRTVDEIRDIYVTRYLDGQWQEGTRLFADDWNIAGCPVNGPSVVASGQDVSVAWFSAANDKPVVRVITSHDSGASFGEAVEIASGRVAGYVGLAALENGELAVSWVAKDETSGNVLLLRLVSASGDAGPVLRIGKTTHLRVFPQLAYADGYLYLAWTTDIEGMSQMKTIRVPVTASRRSQSS